METSNRSEYFLRKLFSSLKEKHFANDPNLSSFYSYYKGCLKSNPNTDLFNAYMTYIMRNYESSIAEQKHTELVDEIFYTIVLEEEPEDNTEYDLSDHKNNYKKSYSNSKVKDRKIETSKIKISRSFALKILSDFIVQSGVRVDDDPTGNKECMAEDQEFRDKTTERIIEEIKMEENRIMPRPKPDAIFAERSKMLNYYAETQRHITDLLNQQPKFLDLIKKWMFIDVFDMQCKKNSTMSLEFSIEKNQTLDAKDIKAKLNNGINERKAYEIIIPSFPVNACYTGNTYSTGISLNSSPAIAISTELKRTNIKHVYICTGSRMICGGGADQGLNVKESYLYLTSTYSVTMDKFNHAYPMQLGRIIVCPNVLVFEDINYKLLPVEKWSRISVINMPLQYRPTTNIKDIDTNQFDERLLEKEALMDSQYVQKIRQILIGTIETALFLGYDNIVLDDLGIIENGMPAHQTAAITLDVLQKFKGRLNKVYVAVDKAKIFDIFKWYFT